MTACSNLGALAVEALRADALEWALIAEGPDGPNAGQMAAQAQRVGSLYAEVRARPRGKALALLVKIFARALRQPETLDGAALATFLAAVLDAIEGPSRGTDAMNLERDAEFWADLCGARELAIYMGAASRRLLDMPEPGLGANTRKRLIARLWGDLSPADRRAFLARVDPEGRFRPKHG